MSEDGAEESQEKREGYAQFVIGYRELEDMIHLAPGIRIRGIYWDATWAGWRVHLEGERLPVPEHGAAPKMLIDKRFIHPLPDGSMRSGVSYELDGESIASMHWDYNLNE